MSPPPPGLTQGSPSRNGREPAPSGARGGQGVRTRRFLITLHALSRFIERYEGSGDLKAGQYRPFLRSELQRAVPIGAQSGDGALYLLPCGCVAVVVWK